MRELQDTPNRLVENIFLHQKIDYPYCELPVSCKDLLSSRTLNGFKYELNDDQFAQKKRCLTRKFTLIQGPPGIFLIAPKAKYSKANRRCVAGTGKSYMGAHIAASFVEINHARNSETPEKVLYCGPSNKAVDVAAGMLTV